MVDKTYNIKNWHILDILSGKVASIQWRPPSTGGYSGFKLKVIPLSEPSKSIRNIVIREDASPFQVNMI